MRILKLCNVNVTNAVATAIPNKNNRLYFNIMIGSRGLDWKLYTMYLSSRHFQATKNGEELELKGNNYMINPVKVNNEIQKDQNGNILYCIYPNDAYSYKKDIVLLWEIPNRSYLNVKYEIKGDVELLAEASYGKERLGVNYKSPIPVLEIFGDCELTWTGVDREGKQVGQIVKYNYVIDQWDIKSIEGVINNDKAN